MEKYFAKLSYVFYIKLFIISFFHKYPDFHHQIVFQKLSVFKDEDEEEEVEAETELKTLKLNYLNCY